MRAGSAGSSFRLTAQQLLRPTFQLFPCDVFGSGAYAEQIRVSGPEKIGVLSNRALDAPTQTIPSDASTTATGDREPDGRRLVDTQICRPHPQSSGAHWAFLRQHRERAPTAEPSNQAESRDRPLSRRALRIARPARVFIRFRKPCFFDRFRLLGW